MKKSLIIILLFCSQMRAMEELARVEKETAHWTNERWKSYVALMDYQLCEIQKKRERIKKQELKRGNKILQCAYDEFPSDFTPEKIEKWFGPRFIERCVKANNVDSIPSILAMALCVHSSDDTTSSDESDFNSGYDSSQEDSESGPYPSFDDSDSSSVEEAGSFSSS